VWAESADAAVTSHTLAETGYFVGCMQPSCRNMILSKQILLLLGIADI